MTHPTWRLLGAWTGHGSRMREYMHQTQKPDQRAMQLTFETNESHKEEEKKQKKKCFRIRSSWMARWLTTTTSLKKGINLPTSRTPEIVCRFSCWQQLLQRLYPAHHPWPTSNRLSAWPAAYFGLCYSHLSGQGDASIPSTTKSQSALGSAAGPSWHSSLITVVAISTVHWSGLATDLGRKPKVTGLRLLSSGQATSSIQSMMATTLM